MQLLEVGLLWMQLLFPNETIKILWISTPDCQSLRSGFTILVCDWHKTICEAVVGWSAAESNVHHGGEERCSSCVSCWLTEEGCGPNHLYTYLSWCSVVVFMSYRKSFMVSKCNPFYSYLWVFENLPHLGLWHLPSVTAGFPQLCKHTETSSQRWTKGPLFLPHMANKIAEESGFWQPEGSHYTVLNLS